MLNGAGSTAASISTHTLTWSVTRTLFVETEQIVISTHTLTWSVTTTTISTQENVPISTHTLTWSVTPEFLKAGEMP